MNFTRASSVEDETKLLTEKHDAIKNYLFLICIFDKKITEVL